MARVGKNRVSINDDDREEWVRNDAGLYEWYLSSRLGMRAFIRANRDEIDKTIAAVLDRPPAS